MQNFRLFNVCEAQRASRRHLKADVLHHLVQAKNLHFNCHIYILYYQSNMWYNLTSSPACYPFKMIYFICNEGVGTASQHNSCTQRHEDMLIASW